MKRFLNKLIAILITIIMLSNIFGSVTLAITTLTEADGDSMMEDLEQGFNTYATTNVLDGIVGILTWIVRAPVAAIAYVIQILLSSIFWFSQADASTFVVTAEDILFSGHIPAQGELSDQLSLLDINFFDLSDNVNPALKALRRNVAQWYYALRNIAIVMSLLVLIYIGIRMAISTVADEKAKYKKMITDWVTSFALLFVLHYIIIMAITFNNQLITLLYNLKTSLNPSTLVDIGDYSNLLFSMVFGVSFIKGWGSLVVYIMLLFVTVALFIKYVMRLFNIGFLIVISPLITVTYSIDKIGDQKSQALDTWLKEFMFNVFIQPFHCIVYLVFVSAALEAMTSGTLAGLVLSIMAILFINQAESLVQSIFGFGKAKSLGTLGAAGAVAIGAASGLKKKVSKAAGAVGGANGSSGSKSSGSGNVKTSIPKSRIATDRLASGKGFSVGNSPTIKSASINSASTHKVADLAEKSTPNTFAQDVGKFVKSLPGRGFKAGVNMAGGVIGAFGAAGATGKLGDIYAGAALGSALGKSVKKIPGYAKIQAQKFKNKQAEWKAASQNQKNSANNITQARSKLDEAIEGLKDERPELTDIDIDNQINDMLNNNPESFQDKGRHDVSQALHGLESAYKIAGRTNASELTTEQAKNMNNRINQSLVNAANQLNSGNATYNNQQLESFTDQIISDINDSAQRSLDYRKTANYTQLSKTERNYAREVYKTKQVMQTLSGTGSSDKQKLRTGVDKKIKKGLQRKIKDGTISVE